MMDRQRIKRFLLRGFPGCEDFLHTASARSQALMPARRAEAAKYALNAPIVHGPLGDPTTAMVEITERCNLNCVMCQRVKLPSQNREMSLDNYRRLLDKVPSLRHITLLGYGEALIHRDIGAILELNRSRNLTTTIVTNGFPLTPELVDLLLPGSILHVSIDSPRCETYRAIRGRELDEVAERVRTVHAHRPGDIFWAVNFIVMPDNLTEMADMVSFTRGLGIWVVQFPLLVGDRHPYADLPAYRRALSAARRRAWREGRFVTFTSGPGFMPCKCIEPYFLLRVTVTGDVYPCCYIHGGERDRFELDYLGEHVEVSQREYLMGNILEAPDVDTIWRGAKFEALRRSLLAREERHGTEDYGALLAAYRKAPRGFAHCEICMWRNGIHC